MDNIITLELKIVNRPSTIFKKILLLGGLICGALIFYGISPVFSGKDDFVWRVYVVLVFGMVFSLGTVKSYQRHRKDEIMCR